MKIGRKIFYLLANGQPVLTVNPYNVEYGDYQPLTKEQEFATYAELRDLTPEAVGALQLEYGQFDEEFKKYPFRVDPETQEIVWDMTVDLTEASLDEVKAAKIAQLNEFCNRAIAAGFKSSATGTVHTYPSDDEAKSNLQIVMKRLEIAEKQLRDSGVDLSVPANRPTYGYLTMDAGYLDHTLDQLETVFADGVDAGTVHVMHFRELKAQVEAATTADEVNAIQW